MEHLNSSIIKSLDGDDSRLLPFIPYLLQDLWEIGSDPEVIIRLLKRHHCVSINSKILDLGCGKGFISVHLAKEFECLVLGIDAVPEFIEEAKFWSDKYHQNHLCIFEVGDIREKIKTLRNYDIIILGSIGPVFGNIESTLINLKPCLSDKGYVVLDDGCIPDNSSFESKVYLTESETKKQIDKSGFNIIEQSLIDDSFMEESDAYIYSKIEFRAKELMQKHPDKKNLFEAYLENQRVENDILENKIKCVTWLLQKR